MSVKMGVPSIRYTGWHGLGPQVTDLELTQLGNMAWIKKPAAEACIEYTKLIHRLWLSEHRTRLNSAPSRIQIKDYINSETAKLEGCPGLSYCPSCGQSGRQEYLFGLHLLTSTSGSLAKGQSSNCPTQRRVGFGSTRASFSVQIQPMFGIPGLQKSGKGGDTAFLSSLYAENTTRRPVEDFANIHEPVVDPPFPHGRMCVRCFAGWKISLVGG